MEGLLPERQVPILNPLAFRGDLRGLARMLDCGACRETCSL